MILFAASILVQIMCVMHILNTGRDRIWIWIVLLFSALGCCAYFAFQVMPELFGPGGRHARRSFAKQSNDPVRKLKAAEDQLALVDTAANRAELGDAYFAMRAFGKAADEYRKALDHLRGRDAKIETKLDWALFENREFGQAKTLVDRMDRPVAVGESDRLDFLRARILAEMGQADEAVAIYSDIVTRLPGEEARCRYSAPLLEMGRTSEAREMLEAVEQQVKHSGGARSVDDRAMVDWAMTELRSLRNVPAG